MRNNAQRMRKEFDKDKQRENNAKITRTQFDNRKTMRKQSEKNAKRMRK